MSSAAERAASAAAGARWPEVRGLAEAALALPPPERVGFLETACRANPALRAEVEAQVAACERAADAAFLAQSAAARAAPLLSEDLDEGRGERAEAPGHAEASRSEAEAALRAALAGRYEVVRELGRGGAATVYLARDLRHGRLVALKVLDPALGASLSADRFLREIRVTAGLAHPNILPLHDSGDAAGLLYYVMPFVEGETLRDRLARDSSLPLAEAIHVLHEVADALAYAHARGLVHRDIKPANILLHGGVRRAHALVADFGIARALYRAREAQEPNATDEPTGSGYGSQTETLTAVGTSPGTPAYMAPEQASGAPVDERADLYALGVVAYEVLAGAHPFGTRGPGAILDARRGELPPPLAARRPQVPPALAALVMRLLARDPADRPPSAEAVLHALEGLSAAPAKRPRTAQRAALASAALLLTSSLAAYFAWHPARAAGQPRALATARAETTRPPGTIRSLAVLPFVNTSRDPQDAYFSDGLTDELAHALAQLPGLRLAGRTSSYALKGKSVPAVDVGRRLGIDAFISATVRRSGNRLRIDAFISATVRRSGNRLRIDPQLVSAVDGTVLWDGAYESHSGDVFAVQDSLTHALVAALAPALGIAGAHDTRARAGPGPGAVDLGRGTRDAEAYELYLKGRYYWHERGADNVIRSIGYFQQAIGRDPGFARAYAALALAYDVLAVYVPDPADSTTPLLEASARRAVTLDSTLADAQTALAVAFARDRRYADAEAHFRAALRFEPSNPYVHHAFGFMLIDMGRTSEAIAQLRQATRLDPLAPSAGTALAEAYIDARRFPEAEQEARRILAIDSTFPLALSSLGLAQALDGKPDSAVRTLEHVVRLYPALLVLQGRLLFAYATDGRWSDVQRMRARLRQPGGDLTGGALTAFADLVLGDREPAIRLLATRTGQRRWIDMLRPTATATGCYPLVDPLWADARYRTAMRSFGTEPCPQVRPWPMPAPPRQRVRGS